MLRNIFRKLEKFIYLYMISIVEFGFFFFFLCFLIFWIGIFLIQFLVAFLSSFYFYLLPTNIIFLSLGIFFARTPIYSLFCLIGVFIHTICFLLSLKVEFLAFLFLIIYVGAVAVLFLFVVMMFNVKEFSSINFFPKKQFFKNFFFFYSPLLVAFYFVLQNFVASLYKHKNMYLDLDLIRIYYLDEVSFIFDFNNYFEKLELSFCLKKYITFAYNDINVFSALLYTNYNFLFLLTAFILLTAMLGALSLTNLTKIFKNYALNAFILRWSS